MSTTRRPLVVGVDGSAASDLAVRWAAGQARLMKRPVRLVHCATSPVLPIVEDEDLAAQRAADDGVLAAAAALMHEVADVDVTTEHIEHLATGVGETLLERCEAADMLVVGAVGHGRLAGLVLGSVSQFVARYAPVPVAVVRSAADPASHRVVVAFDGSEPSEQALDFALAGAVASGSPVTAIQVWHGLGYVMPLPDDAGWRQVHEQEALEGQLAVWREKYPDVHLVAEAIPGHPTHVLASASVHAAALVVGASRRRPVTGTLLGSVAQGVLSHAQCPVVVAR
jgi:nucleotide-binding universal stress UspA family protein